MFDWTTLATLAGTAAATRALTQMAKGLFGLSGRGCQAVALVFALTICVTASVATGAQSWQDIALAALNAPLAAASAMGLHETVKPEAIR